MIFISIECQLKRVSINIEKSVIQLMYGSNRMMLHFKLSLFANLSTQSCDYLLRICKAHINACFLAFHILWWRYSTVWYFVSLQIRQSLDAGFYKVQMNFDQVIAETSVINKLQNIEMSHHAMEVYICSDEKIYHWTTANASFFKEAFNLLFFVILLP